MPESNSEKLPANVRVMIALVASPTLMIIAYIVYLLAIGHWSEITIGGIIFSALGVFAYFVAIVGRLPTFISKKA